MAAFDGLTGVANRRHFDEALEQEWRRCGRTGTPLAVVLFDVDHFKTFNDHYGHQAGDDCLRRVGQALAAGMQRGGELLARYGGEEFAAVLPGADLTEAQHTAERLRRLVSDCAIPHERSATARVVTVSAGVAAAVPAKDGLAELLVAAADAALYQAKNEGRNRVAAKPAQLPSA
jgi:diguanylate cyclase (GGDEF)-like protein